MPLLDHNGRLFGKLNLFDLFLVLVILAISALAYQRLTVDYRVAPPYALEERQVALTVQLQLPQEHGWLSELATVGLKEFDPRSGEIRAEVLGNHTENNIPLVTLRLNAVRDGADRLLYRGTPLLPGRALRLELESIILDGIVRQVTPESP